MKDDSLSPTIARFHFFECGACSFTGSRAGCKRPTIPLLQTLRVDQSVAEGATQCCDGVLLGVRLVVHERRQLRHHPPLSHHLHWVKRVSQDRAGPPNQSLQSLPVSSWNAAAPANYYKEDGRCHHRVIKSLQERPLHSKGPQSPEQIQSALALHKECTGMIGPVQFIVQVNTQVLIWGHWLHVPSLDIQRYWGECLRLRKSTTSSLVFPALIWRQFCWHQSTRSCVSPLYSLSSLSPAELLQVTGGWVVGEVCSVEGEEEQSQDWSQASPDEKDMTELYQLIKIRADVSAGDSQWEWKEEVEHHPLPQELCTMCLLR